MDVNYQLSPVNFPSESSPLPSLGIELILFGYGSNQCLYPLYHVSLRKHCDKHNDKHSPKNVNNVHNTSSQKYWQVSNKMVGEKAEHSVVTNRQKTYLVNYCKIHLNVFFSSKNNFIVIAIDKKKDIFFLLNQNKFLIKSLDITLARMFNLPYLLKRGKF